MRALAPVEARGDGRSIAELTREALLTAIIDNAFPGDRLPPEARLAAEFGVSRATLRAALHSLEADGILTRRRRFGTTINRHVLRSSMRLNRLVAFSSLIAQQGHEPSERHTVDTQPAAEFAAALEVDAETPCLFVDRLLSADGMPVITITDVVPLDRLTVEISEVDPGDSTFALIARNCIAPVDYATSDLLPQLATREGPPGLRLAPGQAYIELLETHFTVKHDIAGVSRIRVDPGQITLSFVRRQA
ncbi:MAG: GntR family transcriptional regulator [Solirubrobacteraceae bacterium]|nr:GntR family transcriptional regulator [Solirubrobacteraceae bacterium]